MPAAWVIDDGGLVVGPSCSVQKRQQGFTFSVG